MLKTGGRRFPVATITFGKASIPFTNIPVVEMIYSAFLSISGIEWFNVWHLDGNPENNAVTNLALCRKDDYIRRYPRHEREQSVSFSEGPHASMVETAIAPAQSTFTLSWQFSEYSNSGNLIRVHNYNPAIRRAVSQARNQPGYPLGFIHQSALFLKGCGPASLDTTGLMRKTMPVPGPNGKLPATEQRLFYLFDESDYLEQILDSPGEAESITGIPSASLFQAEEFRDKAGRKVLSKKM